MRPICCICGSECENEWGNNPYPISKDVNDRCCNVCNDNYVIPARIKNYLAKKKEEENKKDE